MDPLVGQLMRLARERKGLKQNEVGKLLGVKGATVSSWELNKNDPGIDELVNFCRLCETDYEDLLRKVYGDPTEPMKDFKCTADEAEIIRRYRAIDERGQRTVRRILDAEYNDAIAGTNDQPPNSG